MKESQTVPGVELVGVSCWPSRSCRGRGAVGLGGFLSLQKGHYAKFNDNLLRFWSAEKFNAKIGIAAEYSTLMGNSSGAIGRRGLKRLLLDTATYYVRGRKTTTRC